MICCFSLDTISVSTSTSTRLGQGMETVLDLLHEKEPAVRKALKCGEDDGRVLPGAHVEAL